MAKFNIKADAHPYYTVEVEFSGCKFEQQVIVADKKARDTKLQAYADEYEKNWNAANAL